MRILITGATGAIGRKLIAKLENTGYALRILARKKPLFFSEKIEYSIGDLQNIKSLNKAANNIDIVIHLAGLTHSHNSRLYYAINTDGTKNLITACKSNDVKKIIHISSRTAGIEGGAYAHSKLLAEKIIISSGLNWMILRLSEVYGTSNKEMISRLLHIIKKSKFIPVIGAGDYLLSPIYIDDVIDVIVVILNNNSFTNKIYTISGPEIFTYNQLIDRLSRILKVERIKISVPVFFAKIIAFLFYLFKINMFVQDQIPRLLCKKPADIMLAKKELNFNPRTIEAGIKRMTSAHLL